MLCHSIGKHAIGVKKKKRKVILSSYFVYSKHFAKRERSSNPLVSNFYFHENVLISKYFLTHLSIYDFYILMLNKTGKSFFYWSVNTIVV